MKECVICKKIISANSYRRKICSINCAKISHIKRNKIYRENNQQTCIDRTIASRKKNKKYYNQKQKDYIKKYPEKARAYQHGIKNKLKRTKCIICKTKKKLELHHFNYKKPKLVGTLCKIHHVKLHAQMKNMGDICGK